MKRINKSSWIELEDNIKLNFDIEEFYICDDHIYKERHVAYGKYKNIRFDIQDIVGKFWVSVSVKKISHESIICNDVESVLYCIYGQFKKINIDIRKLKFIRLEKINKLNV